MLMRCEDGRGSGLSEFWKLEYLGVFGSAVDYEADQGRDTLEALPAGGAGIDMQQVELVVVHYLEYMAVAAHKDVGLFGA